MWCAQPIGWCVVVTWRVWWRWWWRNESLTNAPVSRDDVIAVTWHTAANHSTNQHLFSCNTFTHSAR